MFSLAQQVYYRDNYVYLRSYRWTTSAFLDSPIRSCLRYPRPSVNWFIRHICLELTLNQNDWRFLQRVANHCYGFENRTDIDLQLGWSTQDWWKKIAPLSSTPFDKLFYYEKMDDFFRDYVYHRVCFQAEGTLAFQSSAMLESFSDLTETDFLDAETAIWEHVTFGVRVD